MREKVLKYRYILLLLKASQGLLFLLDGGKIADSFEKEIM